MFAPAYGETGLVAASVAASVAIHGAVLALGPPPAREPVWEPPQVLSVMIREPRLELEPPPPPPPAPAPAARPAAPRPAPRVVAPRTPPPRAESPPVAAAPAEPNPAAGPIPDAGPEEERRAVPAAPVVTGASPHPASPPDFRAAYLRNPSPAYPAAARRNGEEGTVTLRVLVSVEGAPREVTLERSSGSGILDAAALATVKTWRFAPARRGGEAHEAWVLVPIVFRLEPGV